MDLSLVFLGTAGAIPTVDRGSAGTLIIRGGERILVDCGEGTQRQLIRSAGLARIDKIFITHLHGDHYLGLPGLIKTLSLQGREDPLHLFGPEGFCDFLSGADRVFGHPRFPLVVHDAGSGVVLAEEGYRILAASSDHGLPGLAWCLDEEERPGRFHPERAQELGVIPGPDFGRLQRGEALSLPSGVVVTPSAVMDPPRAGRKVVLTGDTRPSESVRRLAEGATVLVHDGTFASSEQERALETRHSTAAEAARTAASARVRALVLIHLSSRHSWRELRDEARAVFPRTVVPRDFDQLVVPYPDKGEPFLVDRGGMAERLACESPG